MTWRQAVEKVLREAGEPLHYLEIYQRIIKAGYRKGGVAVTVNVTLTGDINSLEDQSMFERVGIGTYRIRKIRNAGGPPAPEPMPQPTARTQPQRQLPVIYLCDDHQMGGAVTLKEKPRQHHNNGWICVAHGSLDFKRDGAVGTSRYLIQEIRDRGTNVVQHPNWVESGSRTCAGGDCNVGATSCMGGTGYKGGIQNFGSWQNAVRYLKSFYSVQVLGVTDGRLGRVGVTQAMVDEL
jgi:hypothetical protein